MAHDDETTSADPPAPTSSAGFRVRSPTANPPVARYERGSEIARGGLGRVTAALDRTLQRAVAIKELHQRTEQGRRRFVREGLTTARLQHPAIVPVLDAGEWDGGDPYLVMKLLEGKTLAEELPSRTTTEARLALVPNLLAVADALGYAHAQGVVHRDVKPANIMLGTHGETVLLDWGVAHDGNATALEIGLGRGPEPLPADASDEQLTVAGTLAGTVRYMSPEQARGEAPNPGFDVYSLGATLATVLTGKAPFDRVTQQALVDMLRTGSAGVPVLPADVPSDLAAIVAKATAKPGDRYAHAGELAADLRAFIAGKLVGARQYSRRQLFARWLARNRILVGIAAAAAIVIAGIAIVAVRSVIDQRNVAVAERSAAESRSLELVLLQARTNLHADPTATLAWLAQYPTDAPHQDEVLEMVDEAVGRGVARHVWRTDDAAEDVEFEPSGSSIVEILRDGSLVRDTLASGVRTPLGAIGKRPIFIRPTANAIYVLDRDGDLHRFADGVLAKHDHVPFPSRATGMFAQGNDIRITFIDDPPALVSGVPGPAASRPKVVPFETGDDYFFDDENNGGVAYVASQSGEFGIADPKLRKLFMFAPSTWVRASDQGGGYMAVVPEAGGGAAIWLGTPAADPVRTGIDGPCAPGTSRDQIGDVANDGRVGIVRRCGVLKVYARDSAPVAVPNADRVELLYLSGDGRWLAFGRSDGLELVEIATGATRRFAGGSAISLAGFARTGGWMFTVTPGQGTRVWNAEPAAHTTGKLGDIAAPARLVALANGEIAIARHLTCARWTIGSPTLTPAFAISVAAVRDIDDEPLLWTWETSSDGRTCMFPGDEGDAVIVREDGSSTTLATTNRETTTITDCAFAGDRVTCREGSSLITFDPKTGGRIATRVVTGKLRGLARGTVLVEREDGCSLESTGGDAIATLPAGKDCRALRASSGALLVERTGTVDVWTGGAIVSVHGESRFVEVSPAGSIAVAHDQAIEIDGKPATIHTRAVRSLAWSSTGLLASADDETVRIWDPRSSRTRVVYAPHAISIAWTLDGRSLVTTDGRVIEQWPIDMTVGTTPAELRRRIAELTSARIVDGRVATP